MEDSIGLDYTGDSSQVGVTELEFFPEGYSVSAHYMSIPGVGFGNTAAKYAEPYAEYVKLNSKVVEVNSEGEELIEVTYVDKDDDGMTKSIKAKTVLITVSLGVLKAGTINFVPSLPANKQASIDNTGFGLNNKAVMTWKNKEDMIWPEDEFWFKLITPDDETSGLWTTFYNPSKFKGEPSLIAWVGGDEAWVEEERTNDEIMKDVIKNLRAMFPGIRNPDTALISRWGMNENVRGTFVIITLSALPTSTFYDLLSHVCISFNCDICVGLYSFPKPGRDFYDDLDTLGERFGNIWFAGEATGSGR
jgi:monoamine oxidase